MGAGILTDKEITYVRTHLDVPAVRTFAGLWDMQARHMDTAGYALMLAALRDVRKLMEATS